MIANRLAILPCLPVRSFCCGAIQLKLARDYCLSEVAFADEIWDNINFVYRFGFKKEKRVAQARLLFPEGTFDISKNFPTPNLRSVRQRRRTRVWIHGGTVRNDEKCAVLGSHRRNVQ